MVRSAILSSVPLKMFVLYEVPLPTYVKLTHFCVVRVLICFSGLGVGGLCGFIGKEMRLLRY